MPERSTTKRKNPESNPTWAILQPVRSTINRAMVLSVLSVVTGLVPLVVIPQIARQFNSVEETDWGMIGGMLGIAGIATIVSLVSKIWSFRVSHLGAFRLEEILRNRLAGHLAQLPLGYIITTGSGALKKLIQDDVKSLHAFVADSTPLMAQAYATPIVVLGILLWENWRMALVTIGLIPIAMILMQLSMKDYAIKRREYDEANEQINHTVIEFVQGMQVVRTFDDGTSSFIRFRDALDEFTTKLKQWSESTATSGRIGYLMFQSLPTLLVVTASGSWMLAQNWITLPTLLLFLLLAPMIIGSFMPLMILRHHINYADMASRKIHQVFAQPLMTVPSQPQIPQDASVQFSHVSFAYDRQLVLSDINFTLPAGSVTALVGPSGSGKSTIARLIPRFWDVNDGSIQIGQVDVRQMTQDTLMSMVSFVFQENFLLYDTVLENIRLGRPTATMAEVEAAARAAQAHEFILGLPEGYNTIVGERGTRLSGGERQRITIARAILQDNPIIILDEATAFTDPENEAAIQTAIATLTQNKTLLIVAHRLSTIVDADQIIVLDRGHIVEIGQHQDLLLQQGTYTNLWRCHTEAQNWQLQVRRRSSVR